jgi:membrane-bound serine protease (ClpP class)
MDKTNFSPFNFCLPRISFFRRQCNQPYRVDSIINPVSAEYIVDSIKTSEKESAQCLIIKRYPGGLDTSMRQIIKEILNASVPIIVYVAPDGARQLRPGY